MTSAARVAFVAGPALAAVLLKSFSMMNRRGPYARLTMLGSDKQPNRSVVLLL